MMGTVGHKPYTAMVRWEDACHYIGEDIESVLQEKEIVETYGILFIKGNYHLVMTHSAGDGNSDIMKIPSRLVVSVRRLHGKTRSVKRNNKKDKNKLREHVRNGEQVW